VQIGLYYFSAVGLLEPGKLIAPVPWPRCMWNNNLVHIPCVLDILAPGGVDLMLDTLGVLALAFASGFLLLRILARSQRARHLWGPALTCQSTQRILAVIASTCSLVIKNGSRWRSVSTPARNADTGLHALWPQSWARSATVGAPMRCGRLRCQGSARSLLKW
jgi:hypothetical protein